VPLSAHPVLHSCAVNPCKVISRLRTCFMVKKNSWCGAVDAFATRVWPILFTFGTPFIQDMFCKPQLRQTLYNMRHLNHFLRCCPFQCAMRGMPGRVQYHRRNSDMICAPCPGLASYRGTSRREARRPHRCTCKANKVCFTAHCIPNIITFTNSSLDATTRTMFCCRVYHGTFQHADDLLDASLIESSYQQADLSMTSFPCLNPADIDEGLSICTASGGHALSYLPR
jgi:hypothetical protein